MKSHEGLLPDATKHEDRFAELLALKANWNSYGAPPIEPSAVDHARPIIARLDALGLTPWIAPGTAGGVSIERAGTDDYSIDIEPDGVVHVCFDGLSPQAALDFIDLFARAPSPSGARGIEEQEERVGQAGGALIWTFTAEAFADGTVNCDWHDVPGSEIHWNVSRAAKEWVKSQVDEMVNNPGRCPFVPPSQAVHALVGNNAPAALRSQQRGEGDFQTRVQPWLMECFGAMIAGDREERNHRFLEEALELVQSLDCTQSEAHQLVDYVYGRPAGHPPQEVGGVMVTLAALCLANDLDMHAAGWVELNRIWGKVEQIRAKQAAKPKHSPLPLATISEGM